MKLIVLLVLITFLTGCMGVVTLGTNKETYGPNVILTGNQNKQLMKSSSPQQVSKEDVLKKWGEPSQKVKDGDLERWVYIQDDLSWTGIMPLLIIPIPLMIPTGHYRTSMTFSGDRLIDSESVTKATSAFFCGISPDGLKPTCQSY